MAFKKTSKSVRILRRLSGPRPIRSRTHSNSACDMSRKPRPLGKEYRRRRLLALSLQTPCNVLRGFTKASGTLSSASNSQDFANPDPLYNDRLFIGLSPPALRESPCSSSMPFFLWLYESGCVFYAGAFSRRFETAASTPLYETSLHALSYSISKNNTIIIIIWQLDKVAVLHTRF